MARASVAKVGVRITQQFRQARGMTYELDCSGVLLVLRIFPPDDERAADSAADSVNWRIEARGTHAGDAIVVTATASSRALAFEQVAEAWRHRVATNALASFDWNAVAQAMTAVRAI